MRVAIVADHGPASPLTKSEQIENMLGMIADGEIHSMADELARAYGLPGASARATEHALAELERGHVGVATTWRRILNQLNRMSAEARPSIGASGGGSVR